MNAGDLETYVEATGNHAGIGRRVLIFASIDGITVDGYFRIGALVACEGKDIRCLDVDPQGRYFAGKTSVAEGHMQTALKSIFAVAEAYPQLQASQNFLRLQADLVDTEDKIQASRRFYNGGVREFNTKIKVFPNNLFARRLGFTEREFFEVDNLAAIAEPPRVQF